MLGGRALARFYSCEELRGARVYDSAGLLYGAFDCYVIREGRMLLRVVVEAKADTLVVDVEELVARLKARGLTVSAGEPLEVLVGYAREAGVEIPYRRAVKTAKMLKALVPVEEVAVIDVKRLAAGGGERVEKVVVLSTPRELRYRGAGSEPARPVLVEAGRLRGKLAVSLSEGVLGYVEDVVVGPGEPGLRVAVGAGVGGYINWIAFLNALKRRGFTDAYARLLELHDPYVKPRLDLSELGKVRRILSESKAPREVFEMLDRYTVQTPAVGSYRDIGWSRVVAVGDIVLVK